MSQLIPNFDYHQHFVSINIVRGLVVESIMAYFRVPNSATLHTIRNFLFQDEIFDTAGDVAVLEFHPKWAHLEPVALSMIASWGAWCRRQGKTVEVRNLKGRENYPARMRLFEHLGIDVDVAQQEHEEVGRFLPIAQVATRSDIQPVIADISALLHLDDDPESLAAVQYCISELLRNVLEHSAAIDGAFVCAHRFTRKPPHRVSIAVADCGQGIAAHLGRAHPDALTSDRAALGLAMRPGVTGAQAGIYGTPDNAGAGLFITRCIAKGTGGYFSICSGSGLFRQYRSTSEEEDTLLFFDAYDDPRYKFWNLPSPWLGTSVAVEIRTDKIADYEGFFQWIFSQIPSRKTRHREIKFT